MIKQPTHTLDTSFSCTDLTFTSLPNLIIGSGVHLSLYPNCHHQIVYAEFNLEITYPPPCLQDVWHYKDANTGLIQRAINGLNGTRALQERVSMTKLTFLNS